MGKGWQERFFEIQEPGLLVYYKLKPKVGRCVRARVVDCGRLPAATAFASATTPTTATASATVTATDTSTDTD